MTFSHVDSSAKNAAPANPEDEKSSGSAQVYSNLKALAFPDRLQALRERRLAAPVNIRIKPINHCNHDCWYCAYRVSHLQLGNGIDLKDVIPHDKMMEITDDIVSMGVRAVTFTGGGEPLLYKSLPECIERLADGGVRVGALTNGSNLKKRMADVFAKRATWIRVSEFKPPLVANDVHFQPPLNCSARRVRGEEDSVESGDRRNYQDQSGYDRPEYLQPIVSMDLLGVPLVGAPAIPKHGVNYGAFHQYEHCGADPEDYEKDRSLILRDRPQGIECGLGV